MSEWLDEKLHAGRLILGKKEAMPAQRHDACNDPWEMQQTVCEMQHPAAAHLHNEVVLVLLLFIAHVAHPRGTAGANTTSIHIGRGALKSRARHSQGQASQLWHGSNMCGIQGAARPFTQTLWALSHLGTTDTPRTPSGSCCMRASQASRSRCSLGLCRAERSGAEQMQEDEGWVSLEQQGVSAYCVGLAACRACGAFRQANFHTNCAAMHCSKASETAAPL